MLLNLMKDHGMLDLSSNDLILMCTNSGHLWIIESRAVLSVCNERTRPLNFVRETVTVGSDEGGGTGVAGMTGGAA